MNTHNNKRRQETIKRIENAFLEQLHECELSQINVSRLCKRADINRGTFYVNFEDVYHLADHVLQRLEQEVSVLLERDIQKAYSEADFLKLFEHIRQNQTLYQAYFKLGTERFKDLALFSITFEGLEAEEELLDLHIAFFRNGFNGMVKKCLENDCKQTPQQMIEVLLREYHGRLYWRLP